MVNTRTEQEHKQSLEKTRAKESDYDHAAILIAISLAILA